MRRPGIDRRTWTAPAGGRSTPRRPRRRLSPRDACRRPHYDGFALEEPPLHHRRLDRRGGAAALAAGGARPNRARCALPEDHWRCRPTLTLTLGGAVRMVESFGGRNFSASPALPDQTDRAAPAGLSPKAVVALGPAARWTVGDSAGRALRFPTVSELTRRSRSGPVLHLPNPDLEPEKALSASSRSSAHIGAGHVRLSLFHETSATR